MEKIKCELAWMSKYQFWPYSSNYFSKYHGLRLSYIEVEAFMEGLELNCLIWGEARVLI